MKKATLSISEKLSQAENLALALGYNANGSAKNTEKHGEEISDEIWSYIDGLHRKYVDDRVTGRCSLTAFWNFDHSEVEKTIDNHIELFKQLIQREEVTVYEAKTIYFPGPETDPVV